jgi:hypothetical protein
MVGHSKHLHGKPVKVLSAGNVKSLKVDYEFLDKVLLHPEVKDRSIVMFSIVGTLRKGKSFYLDYCLRFLYAHVSSYLNFVQIVKSYSITFFPVQVDKLFFKSTQ